MRGIKREISGPVRNLGPKSYDALKDIKKQVSGPPDKKQRLGYRKVMELLDQHAERARQRSREARAR